MTVFLSTVLEKFSETHKKYRMWQWNEETLEETSKHSKVFHCEEACYELLEVNPWWVSTQVHF